MTDSYSDIDTVICILLAEDLLAQLRTAETLPAPAVCYRCIANPGGGCRDCGIHGGAS